MDGNDADAGQLDPKIEGLGAVEVADGRGSVGHLAVPARIAERRQDRLVSGGVGLVEQVAVLEAGAGEHGEAWCRDVARAAGGERHWRRRRLIAGDSRACDY